MHSTFKPNIYDFDKMISKSAIRESISEASSKSTFIKYWFVPYQRATHNKHQTKQAIQLDFQIFTAKLTFSNWFSNSFQETDTFLRLRICKTYRSLTCNRGGCHCIYILTAFRYTSKSISPQTIYEVRINLLARWRKCHRAPVNILLVSSARPRVTWRLL